VIPGWLAVVPPLVAIGLALLFKDVLVSLFVGVFSGALILHAWNPFTAFARSIDAFIAPALADASHAKILIFSTLLGGMVGVISRSGGTRGIVARLTPFASNSRRGQLVTWAMGVAIFFDDYANTLIVGSTMRPVTDRLRISREKLAYIVDSTAAPVASVVPISTWIGFEIGLIGAAFADLGLDLNPYTTFVATIPYRFYPLLALVLGFAIAATGRDFGPMFRAERRAMTRGEVIAEGDRALADYAKDALEPPAGIPHRAANAVVPILTVVVVTLLGLYLTGSAALERADFGGAGEWLREVFAASDSYNSLLWASLAGVLVAIVLPLVQRLLALKSALEGMVEGFKSMLLALIVLVLAWSISAVCAELHTAEYLVAATQGVLSPHWLPVLVFVLSAATAFATGTSWGTMGILVPLVIPISHGLSTGAGFAPESPTYYVLMLGTISSVLAGSVWGDHCSPISDTTILSSMASGCDHIAHVRTQLPYALAIGVLGMVVGDVPTAYGLSPWVSLAVGTVVIVGGVLWLGKKVPGPAEPA
jgi:Na+/H+ antiporter NhaC